MPIVISEFEIVPEPPRQIDAAAAGGPQVPPRPAPHELALAVVHELRREARVRAD